MDDWQLYHLRKKSRPPQNLQSLPMATHPAATEPDELLRDCDVRRLRRGGPGGQHRNKVETAIVLRHRPSGITAEANERRSQSENLAQALGRLRIQLALAIRGEVSCAEFVPSACWRGRARGGRIHVNPAHEDFPALLAEALDVTAATEFDLAAAAALLEVTTTQLSRFLHLEPEAWQLVDVARQRLGLRRLR
jgi:hypothetical protein